MPGIPTRTLSRITILFVVMFAAACSQSPNGALEQIVKSFGGKWKVVSLDRGGKKSNANSLKEMSVTVEGDKFQLTEMSSPEQTKDDVSARGSSHEEYILQVNPANKGEIDLVYTTGDNKGKSRPGLFTQEGEKLTLCFATVGSSRPVQISSGQNLTVFVLERQP